MTAHTRTGHRPASSPISVAVVDNHHTVLDGVRLAVDHEPRLRLDQCVEDVAALDLAAPHADVLVLDLNLGRDNVSSVPAIPRLTEWGASVLLYTACEFPVPLRQAVAAGAAGLSLKNDGRDALVAAVLSVAHGEFACSSALAAALLHDVHLVASLTPREVEVVTGIGDGLTHQQLATRHHIVTDTVNDYLKSVRRKYVALGRSVTNAHSLVREARRDGWIP